MIQKSTSYPQMHGVELDRWQAVARRAAGASPAPARCRSACRRAPTRRAHPGTPARRDVRAGRARRRPPRRADRRRQPVRDDVADGGRHRRRVDRPEVAEQPQDVGRADVVAQHRREVLAVARPVHDDAVERRLAAALGEHHVDRVVVRPGDAPQVGGRAVRGDRARPGRQHGGGDPLLARRRRCRRAGRPRDAAPRAHRASARGTTPPGTGRAARRPATSPARGARRRTRRALEDPHPPWGSPRPGKGKRTIWAGSVPDSGTDPALIRIPPRWGTWRQLRAL